MNYVDKIYVCVSLNNNSSSKYEWQLLPCWIRTKTKSITCDISMRVRGGWNMFPDKPEPAFYLHRYGTMENSVRAGIYEGKFTFLSFLLFSYPTFLFLFSLFCPYFIPSFLPYYVLPMFHSFTHSAEHRGRMNSIPASCSVFETQLGDDFRGFPLSLQAI
jgi:hypothetical protein